MGLMTYFQTVVYNSITNKTAIEEYMRDLPPAFKAMFGDQVSLATLKGWLQLEVFGWLPFLMAIYAGVTVAGIVSRELDRGTAEFLFGLPVGRARLVLTRFAAFGLTLALLHLAILAGTRLGAAVIDEAYPLKGSLNTLGASFIVVLAMGALDLLVSVFIADYSRALFAGLGINAGLYFTTVALQAGGVGKGLPPWLVFGRYDVSQLMGQGVGAADVAVLAGYVGVLLALAVGAFSRRDLRL